MSYQKKVLPILRQTRKILLPSWGKARIVGQKNESAFSVITKADFAVEEFLRRKLRAAYPHIQFVGEENGGNRKAKNFWLVDPIDGTAHFVRGLPFCTTMLALVEGGAVNFSAIYDFLNDHLYWAQRGQGAFLNTRRLRVSSRSLKDAYLSAEMRLDKKRNLAIFMQLRKRAASFRTFSAGWEFAMVASGSLDGRLCIDPFGQDYDYAPGCLLVAEAGGKVANVGSKNYDYRNLNFIAANPVVYKGLTYGPHALFPVSE